MPPFGWLLSCASLASLPCSCCRCFRGDAPDAVLCFAFSVLCLFRAPVRQSSRERLLPSRDTIEGEIGDGRCGVGVSGV